jgi:uncharacterized protein YggE
MRPLGVSRTVSRALLLGALICAASARLVPAQQAQVPETPVLSVSGLGEVSVTPDRAAVVLGVETRRPTAAQATAENSRITRAVLDAVRATGVAAEDVSTADFSVNPELAYDQPKGTTRVVGYLVRNTVRVRVQKLENTGAVLDAALSRGANTVQSLEFISSTLPTARREALANAVEQAKADADVMARAAGGSLGPLLELSVQEYQRPMPYTPMLMASAMGKVAEAAPPVAGGQQTLSVRVSGRWRYNAPPLR